MKIKFEILLITDTGIAILNGNDGHTYKSLPPYNTCEKITYTEYQHIAYGGNEGTCYPTQGVYEDFAVVRSMLR